MVRDALSSSIVMVFACILTNSTELNYVLETSLVLASSLPYLPTVSQGLPLTKREAGTLLLLIIPNSLVWQKKLSSLARIVQRACCCCSRDSQIVDYFMCKEVACASPIKLNGKNQICKIGWQGWLLQSACSVNNCSGLVWAFASYAGGAKFNLCHRVPSGFHWAQSLLVLGAPLF